MALKQAADRSPQVAGLRAIQRKAAKEPVQRRPVNQGSNQIEPEFRRNLSLREFLNLRGLTPGIRDWINETFWPNLLGPIAVQDVLGLIELEVRQTLTMRHIEYWLLRFRDYRLSLDPTRQFRLAALLQEIRLSGARFVRLKDLLACVRGEMGFAKEGQWVRGDAVPPIPEDWIAGINTRRGERGLFGSHKGDHTSAHVLFRRWLITSFRGLSIADISAVASDLRWDVVGLFNRVFDADADEMLDYQVSNAWTEAMGEFREALAEWDSEAPALQGPRAHRGLPEPARQAFLRLCVSLMNLRNCLPYAAMKFGGTGGGEGPVSANIVEWDDFFQTGVLGHDPNITKLTIIAEWDQLVRNTLKLMDLERTHAEFSEGDSMLDLELVPGRTGDQDVDFDNVIFLHIESLRMAFPSFWAGLARFGLLNEFIADIRAGIFAGDGEDYDPALDPENRAESGMESVHKKRKKRN